MSSGRRLTQFYTPASITRLLVEMIAAAMGHSLIETQSRYGHMIEDARLSPMKPMAEAISEARAELAEAGASSVCLSGAPTVLRRSLGSA